MTVQTTLVGDVHAGHIVSGLALKPDQLRLLRRIDDRHLRNGSGLLVWPTTFLVSNPVAFLVVWTDVSMKLERRLVEGVKRWKKRRAKGEVVFIKKGMEI
jgi:hypothetical protein